ncbi:MAG: pyridoxamine 5'-phosphate oxidase family protein [Caldilinea sp.]
MTEDSLTPSVRRTIEVLESLLAHPQGLTLKELLASVDGSRSSIFMLLSTLKLLGYVEQSERRSRYRAGARLLAWRATAPPALNTDLLQAFFQEAEAAHLDETLALAAPLANGETQVLGQVEGKAGVRSVFGAGQRLPAESAVGRLFHGRVVQEILDRRFSVAQRDDAVDVAFPICRDGVQPAAALALSAPAFRWKLEENPATLSVLGEMAARLSYRLGAPFYAPWREKGRPDIVEMALLDDAQIAAVLAAPWMARLACVGRDGAPHVIPVWHEWDHARCTFHILAWRGSRWAEYLLENPQVSLTVDEPWPPLRRVSARGSAMPEYDGDDLRLKNLLARLSRRYLGKNAAASLAPQVERSFVITPQSLRGWQGMLAEQTGRIERG